MRKSIKWVYTCVPCQKVYPTAKKAMLCCRTPSGYHWQGEQRHPKGTNSKDMKKHATNDLLRFSGAAVLIGISRQAVSKAVSKKQIVSEQHGPVRLIREEEARRYKQRRAKNNG